jgi:NADPH-dependent glutamate synthase beta subunit-like oxidoreductase
MGKNVHYVAIFGGAVAGSEAVTQLIKHDIKLVVFDQNALPHGKIESGLPKWHIKLRDKQEEKINEKISDPRIKYVPNVHLGTDIDFNDVVKNWGFSAVLLAHGAWRDRPLPVQGIDEYVGRGFYYQNPLIAWFNQYHDPDYKGEQLDIVGGGIVVGGGLASLDIVKMLMLITVSDGLKNKGHDVDVLTLEHKGISTILDGLGLTLEDIGVKRATLYTRQRIEDMPVAPMPENADETTKEKVYNVRKKVLKLATDKYLYNVVDNLVPAEKIVKNGSLNGLKFQKTKTIDDKMEVIEGEYVSVETPLVISAIGSIPELIPGIPTKGEVYSVLDIESGLLDGFDNVFILGNAVTGRGNIRDTQKHGRKVTERIVDQFMVQGEEDYQELFDRAESLTDLRLASIGEKIMNFPPLSDEKVQNLEQKIEVLQKKSGYDENYDKWVEKHTPLRLEKMINYEK